MSQEEITKEVENEEVVSQEVSEETPDVEAEPEAVAEESEAGQEAEAEAEGSEYAPNLKFNALGQEHEIDEMFAPLMKDAESEEKVRKLFEKAYGLDHVKGKNEHLLSQYEELKNEYEPIKKDLTKLSNYLQNGDLDSFFEGVGVTQNQLFHYVDQKLKELDMPEHQRHQLDEARRAQRERDELQENYSQAQTQMQQMQAQQLDYQLGAELSKPDVSEIVREYDTRLGQGAFRNEVIQRAFLVQQTRGVTLSPDQAVKEVLNVASKFIQPSQNQSQGQLGGSGGTRVVRPESKPTIPSMKGSGASPVGSGPRSIDDLRKLASSLT